MNTIEQAREVSELLRGLMATWPLPQEAADVIDGLIEQLARSENELLAATIRIDNDLMELERIKGQVQERKPFDQDWIEERAHRRCRRYIMIDTEAPYRFNGHTLMDLARDIEAKIKEQP